MPVVFDEVVGSVEPERGGEGGGDAAPEAEAGPPSTFALRTDLRRIAAREARLAAD